MHTKVSTRRLAATEGHEVLLLRLKQARHPHQGGGLSASNATHLILCAALLLRVLQHLQG